MDKEKKKKPEEKEKEYGGRATRVCQKLTLWQYLTSIIIKWNSFIFQQKENSYMAKTAIASKHSFDNWLLDSGASDHMTLYREDLEDKNRCNIIVILADDSEIQCSEVGICSLNVRNDKDNR